MKSTPGPWQVSGIRRKLGPHNVLAVGPDVDGGWIVSVHYSDRTPKDHVQSHADARLIAAAPDLLEACQKVVNNWDDLHHKDLMQLRAAIAKAEGK